MILALHIVIALATISSAIGSVALANRRMVQMTPYLLGGTLLSGIGLLFTHPAVSVTHLCVSGLALSAVTIVLHLAARHRLAYTS